MGNFHSKRSVGKPRKRWENVDQKDAVQIVGVPSWRRQAGNGDQWRWLVREILPKRGSWVAMV
jgi:hypothetical protein